MCHDLPAPFQCQSYLSPFRKALHPYPIGSAVLSIFHAVKRVHHPSLHLCVSHPQPQLTFGRSSEEPLPTRVCLHISEAGKKHLR